MYSNSNAKNLWALEAIRIFEKILRAQVYSALRVWPIPPLVGGQVSLLSFLDNVVSDQSPCMDESLGWYGRDRKEEPRFQGTSGQKYSENVRTILKGTSIGIFVQYNKRVSVVAQLEEAPAITPIRFYVLGSDFPPRTANQAVHISEGGEFVQKFSVKNNTLTCALADPRKPLYGPNTH